MSRRKKIIIANFVANAQAGKDGKDGKDGTIVNFPIDDDVVRHVGNERNGQLLSNLLDELLYEEVAINSFDTPVKLFEIGQVLTSLNFTWSLNKNIVSQSITGIGVIAGQTLTTSDRSKTINLNNVNGSTIFTLTVEDSTGTVATRDVLVTFAHGVYVGKSTIPGNLNSAFILSLNKNLQLSRQRTFSVNTDANEYIYIAFPVDYGNPVLSANGFVGGFDSGTIVSFTNSFGQVEDYFVFRSINDNLGETVVEIA